MIEFIQIMAGFNAVVVVGVGIILYSEARMNKTELHELRLIIDLLDRIEQSVQHLQRELTNIDSRLEVLERKLIPRTVSAAIVFSQHDGSTN